MSFIPPRAALARSRTRPAVRRSRHTTRRAQHLGMTAALALLALPATPALAETYHFTSPNFTSAYIGAPGPTGAYTSSMRVTGSFTTAAPLPANMPLTPIGPGASPVRVTSWSFFDGVRTYTSADSALLYGLPAQFAVATDATGQIIDHEIDLIQPPPPHVLNQVVASVALNNTRTLVVGDSVCQAVSATPPVICTSVRQMGARESAQGPGGGTWTVTADPASVPTLSLASLAALGAALAGVAAASRRRRAG